MGKVLLNVAFIPGVISGLTLGVLIKTGVSIDPVDILAEIARSIFALLNNGGNNSIQTITLGVLSLVSIIASIVTVLAIIFSGLFGIIAAACGFVGILLLVTFFSPLVGVLLLILGEGI